MRKVLIVEDEPFFQDFMYKLFEHLQLLPEVVSNGEEALEILKQGRFDLIVTDIKMPKMDGIEFLKKIRKKGNKTPVIVVTGFIPLYNRKMILDMGADAFLTKPFNISEFTTTLSKLGVLK